ncbi:MAG TPA: hypothetical protein VIV66_18110 [Pyrinomonadaceae bacterium]
MIRVILYERLCNFVDRFLVLIEGYEITRLRREISRIGWDSVAGDEQKVLSSTNYANSGLGGNDLSTE